MLHHVVIPYGIVVCGFDAVAVCDPGSWARVSCEPQIATESVEDMI